MTVMGRSFRTEITGDLSESGFQTYGIGVLFDLCNWYKERLCTEYTGCQNVSLVRQRNHGFVLRYLMYRYT